MSTAEATITVSASDIAAMKAALEAMQKQNAELKAALEAKPKAHGKVHLKVTEKGQIATRGLRGTSGQFGLPLYVATIADLWSNRKAIADLVAANADKLSYGKDGVTTDKAEILAAVKAFGEAK